MLTDVACKRAKAQDKPYKLTDGQGMYLYVTPTGFKSWRWKYRIGGKEKRLVFGPYPAISPAKARMMREDAARQLLNGVDPAIDKVQRAAAQTARLGATFRTIAEDWLESQAQVWTKGHAKVVKASLERDVFPSLGHLPIDSITTPMVLNVLRPIEQRGAIETAHRARQRISDVFARAIGSGIVQADPAGVAQKALSPIPRGKHPAVRTIEAARTVLLKVEAEPAYPLTKLASRLLALTAVRSGVLRLAAPSEFEDLDGPEPLWRIPATKMKLVLEQKKDAAYEFVVPLSRQAVETVKMAMDFSGNGPVIFRSIRHPRRPLSDATLSKAYREAGFSGKHVPHGWRSTFSTIMNEEADREYHRRGGTGVSPDRAIIELMLAHVLGGVEGHYNRAAYMPRRRELAQQWADMLIQDLAPLPALLEGLRQNG
ncbi:integrase arm-type DNA-binding domain-containing protein [Sphingomonadaceae bacterium OTU29MARTA1]|nr:integrase arm-type DNA-binding domain-containing protein [Sphingomonadaceae bacterium OTU29MARTA1]